MKLNKREKLYLAESVRILVTILILYGTNYSPFYKIVLIMIADLLDRDVPNLFFPDWINGSSNTYQRTDKIADSICYTILLFYILSTDCLSKKWNVVLFGLFLFRSLGVSLFLKNNDRKYLFYFPNFYLELSLLLFAIKEFKGLKKYDTFLIILMIFYKIITEYFHHYLRI